MAHQEQINYLIKIKSKFPEKFSNCSVLDIGSLDVNGNNRHLFQNYSYVGVDIGAGNNVDFVCNGHEFRPNKQFDIVISTECFEHDPFYEKTIFNSIDLTKPKGMFLFTCATEGRAEHGTRNSNSAWASPHSNIKFDDYYKNVTQKDVEKIIDLETVFSDFKFEVNLVSHDLYFYGIKK
jgi:SAM-dependent methyltransferase